ncbi:MAG TPA: hypothetical protein VML00_07315 [Bacteroidota bacterium]|nr:hypothetical protein [Bacteroidota bacterium]
MRRRLSEPAIPDTMMVWTVNDTVIEDADLLDSQLEDIRRAGFDGTAVSVRCSRYTWSDGPARRALARISARCRESGLQLWTCLDPRFISRTLIGEGRGADLLLFGDSTRAGTVPNTAPVAGGKFSIRCALSPRHGHMFNEVALEYRPIALLRCYAVPDGPPPFRAADVRDITHRCRMFYNARDRYVEAFGAWTPPGGRSCRVVAFFHVTSSHVDYSSRAQMRLYARHLARLRHAGVRTGSLVWDEAGYTCTYGSLPFTRAIRAAYRRAAGVPLEREAWKMAFDAADGSHARVRTLYYSAIQRTVNDAQRAANAAMRRLWGSLTLASIHDTWHFESADMCDMNHGSMDLWRACREKSGGFVDLGGVNVLRDPRNPYYANLAALNVIAASLGRHSRGKFAFNNLWTIGDDGGEGWQKEVMDHCVNVMALFGVRWLAHAYGPAGTIGEEQTFLGSPPLPGYPAHSTWSGFPAWNRRLKEHFAACHGRLPGANVLLLFPVETLYTLGDTRADASAARIFSLILALVDAQFQLDVVSTTEAGGGAWTGEKFRIGRTAFDAVIVPFATSIDARLMSRLRANTARTLFVGDLPRTGRRGGLQPPCDPSDVVRILQELGVQRPVTGPPGTWVSATEIPGGMLATIVPGRFGNTYEGALRTHGGRCALPRSSGLTRVLEEPDGNIRAV